jgi:glutathione S-transferase
MCPRVSDLLMATMQHGRGRNSPFIYKATSIMTNLTNAPGAESKQHTQGRGNADLILVIGNKNYSSWSMRAWVALRAFDIPFKEVRVLLDQPDTKANIQHYCAAARVPVLIADGLAIWDSMAICEYAAERFPDKSLWPRDAARRAMARSIVAEMHSGFGALRYAMSFNVQYTMHGRGRTPAAAADIARISQIWETCQLQFGREGFLFGDFSIADAFYAPLVVRFRTFGVTLAPSLQAYCERMLAHPAVARWIEDALAETERAAAHDEEIDAAP